jgi:predicted NAD-dependent protein-ADP-ribosyltransferase YbiA (DUF1768 family)
MNFLSSIEMSHPDDPVCFYSNSSRGTWGCFSTFSDHQITREDGRIYPTVEHLLQSLKFELSNPKWAEEVRLSSSPGEAARKGRKEYERPMVLLEHSIKATMRLKVKQHPDVLAALLDTGSRLIYELPPIELYSQSSPSNIIDYTLGWVWMQIREEVKAK